jgi:hypothetical protein
MGTSTSHNLVSLHGLLYEDSFFLTKQTAHEKIWSQGRSKPAFSATTAFIIKIDIHYDSIISNTDASSNDQLLIDPAQTLFVERCWIIYCGQK